MASLVLNALWLWSVLNCICLAVANVEKEIFISPAAVLLPDSGPSLANLHLDTLSPSRTSLRTNVNATFPTDTRPHGSESWFLLHTLKEKTRYEVRICWAATQPSSFKLDILTMDEVFASAQSMQGLNDYVEAKTSVSLKRNDPGSLPAPGSTSSIAFLRLYTAADYYTTNASLMKTVPPVKVDIILDRYVLNVFPESLLPTTAYLIVVAVIAWYASSFVYQIVSSSRLDESRKNI